MRRQHIVTERVGVTKSIPGNRNAKSVLNRMPLDEKSEKTTDNLLWNTVVKDKGTLMKSEVIESSMHHQRERIRYHFIPSRTLR